MVKNDTLADNLDFSIPTHFQQRTLWGNFKMLHGWDVLRFNVEAISEDTTFSSVGGASPLRFTLSVFVRTFKNVFSLAYIPMGPDCINENLKKAMESVYSEEDIKKVHLQIAFELAGQIKPYLPKNTICLRMDPPINFISPESRNEFIKTLITNKNFVKKVSTDIQPPDTAVLDITQDESDLLKNMKSKWRYNIKLAIRKGVIIKRYGSEKIDIFYNLFKLTAERDGIATHAKSYYKSLLSLSESQSQNDLEKTKVILYIAHAPSEDPKNLGDPLAGIIVLQVKGSEAIYLYGASSNKKRNLMPAYVLQWTAIQDAKAFGCKSYDFYGIPPTDDENHPMHGLWRFKTGFGGTNIHRLGSVDVPMSWMYVPYIKLEKLRAWYYKDFKKKRR
ncbi:MAG: hypothetical protein BKP49_01755 [Treponema sp. CETP13]|nr:MAG: hypothetical protein BKP49_01755 [Treponema sp. CETP13]